MTTHVHIRAIMILLFLVSILPIQVAVLLIDGVTVSISSNTEMKVVQLSNKNIISIDTLKLGSDYVDIDDWGLATCNDYLYMVNSYMADEKGKMIIVDISDPTNLVEAGRVESLGSCLQISVLDDRAYVVDETNGLWIFNVSNPANVSVLGLYSNYRLYGAYIDQQIAYLATHENGLRIVNVSDPTNLIEIGFSGTSIPTYRVYVQDNYAYIANHDGLEIINVIDPRNPTYIGNVDCSGFKTHISLKDDLVFITMPYNRLKLFNVSRPAEPVELDECFTIGGVAEIQTEGTLLFTTGDYSGLQVFYLYSYNSGLDLGRFSPDGQSRAVLYKDGYLYLVDHHSGLWCLEHDCDEDELYSRREYEIGTPPDNPDADSDLLPDGWEVRYSLNPFVDDSYLDPDMDDLDNLQEYRLGTSPVLADSDGDGYLDPWEYNNGFDPLNPTVGLLQYFVSILGWTILGVLTTMGTIATLWILKQYKFSDTYEGYPYDETSSRR